MDSHDHKISDNQNFKLVEFDQLRNKAGRNIIQQMKILVDDKNVKQLEVKGGIDYGEKRLL